MYNFEPRQYFSGYFNFLKNKDNNTISIKKTAIYLVVIVVIIIVGQIVVYNSDPYKSDNIENEKFIKAEIKTQIIFDTITMPIKQSCFNNYSAIKLNDGTTYRLNLVNNKLENKIVKNALISKKANDKIFQIINNNIKYNFEIKELNNIGMKTFAFWGSIFISLFGIPIWLKQNELEIEYEKNRRKN